MTKHNQGVFELTERIFSQITFPNHLMVGSPKEHSDDVVKHSDDAVMQEEQEQACSSNKHSDDAVTQEQEQACLSKEHSDTQEQACSSKEHSDDAVIQEQALQLSREKQH